MKKLKYILFVLSVICFSLGIFACGGSEEPTLKDGNLNLLVKEYTLNVGTDRELVYEYDGDYEVKFESSDTDVVQVSNDGKLSAIKEGVVFVTIYANTKSDICRVNITDTEYFIDLGYSEYSMVTGSSLKLTANTYKDSQPYSSEVSWSISDSNINKYEFTVNGNSVTFNAKDIGYYTITATNGKASASCKIKVLNENAKRADAPSVSVDKCNTLKWNKSNDIDTYQVIVDGQNPVIVNGTSMDITQFIGVENLPYGKDLKIMVKTYAQDNFDYVDSYLTGLSFSHDYAMNETTEVSCFKAGVMVFTCNDCNRTYTDNNYFEPHNYVDGACTVCNDYKTNGILYFYDSNFIPMPTPSEVSDASGKWRTKYAEYYDINDYDTDGESLSVQLWLAVTKNKDSIPEEEREKCYYVHGLKDTSLQNVYVSAYYDDGVHGKLPVRYVRNSAFYKNETVKNIILPETVTEVRGATFARCLNLKKVVMPGVKFLPAIDEPQYNYLMNVFNNCQGLECVVVGAGFVNEALSFRNLSFTGNEKGTVDIYVYADNTDGVVLMSGSNASKNHLLSGNAYAYDENAIYCEEFWHYDDNGLPVITKHEYVGKGDCLHCGQEYPNNVNYGYDANYIPMPTIEEAANANSEWRLTYSKYVAVAPNENTPENWWKAVFDNRALIPEDDRIKCYYVKGPIDSRKDQMVIPATYKGAQGVLPVKYVGHEAFNGNKYIKKIIATETLTELRGACFQNCISLTTAVFPGVRYLPNQDLYTTPYYYRMANFNYCDALTKLVVAGGFQANGTHFRYSATTQVTDKIDLYVYASSTEGVNPKLSDPTAKWNKLVTDRKFIYDDPIDGLICNTSYWHYDEDNEPVRNSHDYLNGTCQNCGCIEMKTVEYAYTDNYIPMPSYKDIEAGSEWRNVYEKYAGSNVSSLNTPDAWWTAVDNNKANIVAADFVKCYYVKGLIAAENGVVNISATYNDGLHGELPVKYLGTEAFANKTDIVKVFATDSIIEFKGRAFANCSNLKVAVFPGLNYLSGLVNHNNIYLTHCQNFNNCTSMTKLVVGADFQASGQNFKGNTGTLSIYYSGTDRPIADVLWNNSTFSANGLLSQYRFAYNENESHANYWHYENGEPMHNLCSKNNASDTVCRYCKDIIE